MGIDYEGIIIALIIIFSFSLLFRLLKFLLSKKKISNNKEKQLYYLKLIIRLLEARLSPNILKSFINEDDIKNIKNKENENILNILDVSFYEKLYYKFLAGIKNMNLNKELTKEEKYFLKNILEIINLINEKNPSFFIKNDFLRSLIFILFNYIENPVKLNINFVSKIFNSFLQILVFSNEIIDKEINNFEKEVMKTIDICMDKFLSNYDSKINDYENWTKNSNINNFENYINNIRINNKIIIPLYLQGFLDYNILNPNKKYISIKLYKYYEIINTFNEKDNNYHLFQGYSLYSIIQNLKPIDIDLNKFYTLKSSRITNKYAKNILQLSVDLLKSKNREEFLKLIEKYKNEKIPKISNNFNDNEKYYQDLFDQLIYSVKRHKYTNNSCIPLQSKKFSALWLSYIEILLLCLTEEQIKENKIKIIFYFIVNIFSPNIQIDSLEFREDTIPLFFMHSIKNSFILVFQEIYKLLDTDYSEYYLDLEEGTKFDEFLSENSINSILRKNEFKNFLKDNQYLEQEINNLKLLTKRIIFPILDDYIRKFMIIIPKNNYYLNSLLYYLFKNSFNYLSEEYDKQSLIKDYLLNFENEFDKDNIYETLINEKLKDEDFIKLIKSIMKSNVMNTAYSNINKWYLSNGKSDLNEESTLDNNEKNKQLKNSGNKGKDINNNEIRVKDTNNTGTKGKGTNNNENKERDTNNNENKEKKEKNINLINNKSLIDYYNNFCNELEKFNFSETFIVMSLPKTIKGFTFRFLKIVLNCNGIRFNGKIDNSNLNDLLEAYLVFVMVHEQNHFMKRFFNINEDYRLCGTPKINNDEGEGGKLLIELLFGDPLIHKSLNEEQAKYILNLGNWENKTLKNFRKDFEEIPKNDYNKSSIIYLESFNSTLCDHSKLTI